MKNLFAGYPSKKEFAVEGIRGLFTGFISFPLSLFLFSVFIAVFSALMMVINGLIGTMSYTDTSDPLKKPSEFIVWIAIIFIFSVIPVTVLTDALRKKERSFIIFYPIGLALSILTFFNLGVF
jgi:hypothetical protein